ncbi:MAG: SDR family oxidoreductase [Nitrospiraceae bacterium]
MKPVAVVTGAGGLIGHYLMNTAPLWAKEWRVLGLTRHDVDLTDYADVRRVWRRLNPQLVIHCAALSRTGACEHDPPMARKLNVEVTARLAELAHDIPFIFFSSDQVFDGKQGWYVETDQVNPLNVYAETKAAAEHVVLQNPKHTVIRTSLNAGHSPTGDRSFVEDMRRAWKSAQTLTLFTDEMRCPIDTAVTARAVWELVASNQTGLFHLAGAERLSRWDIGQLLAQQWSDLDTKMVAGSVSEYVGPTRPPDLSLNCHKVQSRLSFRLPSFRDWADGRREDGEHAG